MLVAHLRRLAADAQNDVHRGVGSGAWLVRRQFDAAVCRQAADHLETEVSPHAFTTHSFSVVESTMRTCEDLNVRCRVTSQVDLDDPFYSGCGWQIEVFPEPKAAA